MKKIISLIILVVLGSQLGFGGTIDPDVPDHKYIEYAKDFHYIGQILISKKNDNSLYSGSCVAYKKDIIITAAHLFYEYENAILLINSKTIPVKHIITHKDYDYNGFGKYDIALCFLPEDMGLAWYPELNADFDESEKLCVLSGFGSSGNFLTGVENRGGVKRAGSNHIDSVNDFLLFCSPSDKNSKRTSLEFFIAPGDSGGGLFIDNKLAGIHSFVVEDKKNKGMSKYGAISAHTRISIYKEWIEKNIMDFQNKE